MERIIRSSFLFASIGSMLKQRFMISGIQSDALRIIEEIFWHLDIKVRMTPLVHSSSQQK